MFCVKYATFSQFQLGMFYGVVFAWTGVVSAACGAGVTKVAYLDRQQNVLVVQNQGIVQSSPLVAKNVALSEDNSTADRFVTPDLQPFEPLEEIAVRDRVKDFKVIPIAISNRTQRPELAIEVRDFLQERGFSQVVVADAGVDSSLSRTTITTIHNNLEAASYLQNTLNLGVVDLASYSDRGVDSEATNATLIIDLGEDAQFFSTDQNFIY